MCFKRVSTVTFRPQSLKIQMMSFRARSDCGPDSSRAARPSSLYRPNSSLLNLDARSLSRRSLTSSHISAPPKLPIVTSSYSTWIFCRGVSGFATDCPCGVWCRGLTTCLLHVETKQHTLNCFFKCPSDEVPQRCHQATLCVLLWAIMLVATTVKTTMIREDITETFAIKVSIRNSSFVHSATWCAEYRID